MNTINMERLRLAVTALGQIGRTAAGGITRLSWSPEFLAGQEWIAARMRAAGMTVRRDPVGNLVGRYEGTDPALPVVMAGSHLDTVPEGGELDGALGVLAAVECVQTWQEAGWRPRRTVEVVATAEEEGTRFGLGCFGSRVMAGELAGRDPGEFKDASGTTLADWLARAKLDPLALAHAVRNPAGILCFIELHVEQGEELELSGVPCGVVSDIIGIDRHWVTVEGDANHAGTTRMDRRRDALAAAAAVTVVLYQAALASRGRYVATVGKLSVWPGATNVIPGQVSMTVETRAADMAAIEEACGVLLHQLQVAEERYGVQTSITRRHLAQPVHLADGLRRELCAAAGECGVSFAEMPSWAGHDSKIMAGIVPTGMLFVPSVAGISHSPQERTRWEAVREACSVLNCALKKLASLGETGEQGGNCG